MPSVLSVVKIVVVVCRNPFRIFGAFRGKTALVVCRKSFRILRVFRGKNRRGRVS